MDHQEMRNAFMRALEIEKLLEDMKAIIEKPSHYTLIDTTQAFKNAVYVIEKLMENEKFQIRG